MTNPRPSPRPGARHNNCSAQQKAEIPIQSLELILRTARRAGNWAPPTLVATTTDRLQFFTPHRPLPSFSPFPLKTNNERDQSLTHCGGGGGTLDDGRRGRHGKCSNRMRSPLRLSRAFRDPRINVPVSLDGERRSTERFEREHTNTNTDKQNGPSGWSEQPLRRPTFSVLPRLTCISLTPLWFALSAEQYVFALVHGQ